MKEPFFRRASNQEISKEIDSGIEEYFRRKLEAAYNIREDSVYDDIKAEHPLKRREIERSVDDFIEKNITAIVSFLVSRHDSYKLNDLQVLNKDLRNFGFDQASIIFAEIINNQGHYQIINREDSQNQSGNDLYSDNLNIPSISEFNYGLLEDYDMRVVYPNVGSGYGKFDKVAEVLAAAYLKNEIRIDRKLEHGDINSGYTKRYFFKKLARYLCENDFGMKPFGGRSDVSDIEPFARSVQRHVVTILDNISTVIRLVGEAAGENEFFWKDFNPHSLAEQDDPQKRERLLEMQQKIFKTFESPDIKKLVFNAVPFAKFFHEAAFKNNPDIDALIAHNLREETDLQKRLAYFQSNKFKKGVEKIFLSDLRAFPELGEEVVAALLAGGQQVILEDDRYVNMLLKKVIDGYADKEKLAIINADKDERMKKISFGVISDRGSGSPYSFHPFELYQALKIVGIDKFLEMYPAASNVLFDDDSKYIDVSIKEFADCITGIHKVFGGQVGRMEIEKIKKESWHERVLRESGLWWYLAGRTSGKQPPVNDSGSYNKNQERLQEYRNELDAFLDKLPRSERKKLFFEGKKMYWLAKQIQAKAWELEKNENIDLNNNNGAHDQGVEYFFRPSPFNMNWERYDCQNVDFDKFFRYFGTHGNIISTLFKDNDDNDSKFNIKGVMKIIEAVEEGADIRGIALSFDKQRYADGVLSGNPPKDYLQYALEDWPPALRKAVYIEEFQIYFENANQYLYQDPKGMQRYAELLQKRADLRSVLGEKIDDKSDLDFRLSLSIQTEEVLSWYIEAANHIGHDAAQKLCAKFQAIEERSGGYQNLHDALYWTPNLKKVESGEARAILDSLNSGDELNEVNNFLQRYDRGSDQFKDQGSIKSLRELKKRVFALEAQVDVSAFSPEILDIMLAPGFNMIKFKNLQQESRFKDLVEGKFDVKQPFKPHVRKFTEQPLSKLLADGLGSFREKIKGTAQDPKGLFDSVRKLIRGREVNDRPLQVADLLKEVPLDMEEDVLGLLREQNVFIGSLLEAKVHAKSDPEGWVCGNYTDCCMSFGDEKNNDYMFNEGTQYFTVKYNGRIIAQSVIVDALNKQTQDSVVLLDNIEVAPNYKHQSALLSRVYKTFWAEYTSKKVKIGTGYSDLIPDGATLEPNNYSPKHHLYCSDATGSHIYDLPKIKGVESLDEILTFANLTERDADTIAEMEKLAYPEELLQGKGQALEVIKKQRELDLPGAASSFILRQGKKVAGYLLVLPEQSKVKSNEIVAHIYDMVVLPEFQGSRVSRKIMERMLDTAKTYNMPAIEFEAREGTSYRLITNPRIAKWVESKGYKLTYDEPMPEYLGGEDFYYVRLERVAD